MDNKVRNLLAQITALESDLRTVLHEQKTRMFYQLDGKRVKFEGAIRKAHRKLKRGISRWIVTEQPQNNLTGPIICAMAIPLALLDVYITFYQAVCFTVYKVAKVQRAEYFVYDGRHLEYLNVVERFHCTYCAYATELVACVSEIVARTDSTFAPSNTRARYSAHIHNIRDFWRMATRRTITRNSSDFAVRWKLRSRNNLVHNP